MANYHIFLSLFFFYFFSLNVYSQNPDLDALLAFKSSSDPSGNLLHWNSTTSPSTSDLCSWPGVSCLHDRVTRLVLEGLQLKGSFEPLTSLTNLRVLSLKHNAFSGSIPDLSNLTSLKLLFLSYNNFSGGFPTSLTSLSKLYRLDLSFNNLSGQIPVGQVNRFTHLLTIRLEGNGFTGQISGLNVKNLQDFNVSGNKLSGQIPFSLSGFPISSFSSNSMLCGLPMPSCAAVRSDPTQPGSSSGAIASPLVAGANPSTVTSSPTSVPGNYSPTTKPTHRNGASKMSTGAITGIILGDFFILALASLLLYCYFWRNYVRKMGKKSGNQVEKIVYSSSPYPNTMTLNQQESLFKRGKMVFYEGSKKFELEDLLKASAEMLGKGVVGTSYKAVLDDGVVVAVKRVKETTVNGKKDFEQQMEVLGKLKHPNLVSLKACYFSKNEKLLIYDFMPNGNLFWLLHGKHS